MAKLVIDFPMNLEKLKPKSGSLRRFSTGNAIIKISDPKPIPNYLRASIGSCHDLCKYGNRRDFPSESINQKQEKFKKIVPEARSSETSNRGNKISRTKELKPKPLVRSDQSAEEKPNKTFLKRTKNIQISRNDAGKGIRSLPLASSSVKIRTSQSFPKEDSTLEIKNFVENSETCNKTSYENVPEKIIHVIELNDENRNEDLAQKIDSSAKSKGKRIGKIVPKENDSSPRKLKIKRGKALEIENGGGDSKGKISLRRVVSDGESIHKKHVSMRGALRHQAIEQKNTNPDLMNTMIEETASKLVNTSKNKVKALVNAFETLITIQDSESSSACTRSV